MTDTATTHEPETTTAQADETFAWTASEEPAEGARASTAKEWLAQLQSMIENFAEQAGPVAREIGAKAAELAAVAGEKAGPFAQRAAEVTAGAGVRLAEKSRDLAAELRRDVATATTSADAASTDDSPVA